MGMIFRYFPKKPTCQAKYLYKKNKYLKYIKTLYIVLSTAIESLVDKPQRLSTGGTIV